MRKQFMLKACAQDIEQELLELGLVWTLSLSALPSGSAPNWGSECIAVPLHAGLRLITCCQGSTLIRLVMG